MLALPSAAVRWVGAWRHFRPTVLNVQCFGPNGLYAQVLGTPHRHPTGAQLARRDVHGRPPSVREVGVDPHGHAAGAPSQRSRVTGCSQVVLDDLQERFGFIGGRVVPNGIDLISGMPASGALRPGTIFAVGRLEWMKGFDLLLEAFAAADLSSETRLVIGGEGSLSSYLGSRVIALGLQERVHLAGRLDSDQVAAYMGSAAAVVVPSRREAFGLVVLEAWRAGAPLIVTSARWTCLLGHRPRDGTCGGP